MAGVLRIDRQSSLSALGQAIAWDVYLAYGRGKDLGQEPDFWMHQLNVTHAPRLDAAMWIAKVQALLGR